MREEKAALRQKIQNLKEALREEDRLAWSAILQEEIMKKKEWQEAPVVFSYLTLGKEVDTLPLIREALSQGKRVYIPVILRNEEGRSQMEASELLSLEEDLAPGTLGILEPRKESLRIRDPRDIAFLLLPGLAFDTRGGRLGYGGGYFDAFLPRLSPRCTLLAAAFSFQVVDEVPMEPHDLKIPALLTEQGPIPITPR